MNMKKLENKVAIITGASGGLGRGTAVAYAKAGADVVICARRLEKLEEVAKGMRRTRYQSTTRKMRCNGARRFRKSCESKPLKNLAGSISWSTMLFRPNREYRSWTIPMKSGTIPLPVVSKPCGI